MIHAKLKLTLRDLERLLPRQWLTEALSYLTVQTCGPAAAANHVEALRMRALRSFFFVPSSFSHELLQLTGTTQPQPTKRPYVYVYSDLQAVQQNAG